MPTQIAVSPPSSIDGRYSFLLLCSGLITTVKKILISLLSAFIDLLDAHTGEPCVGGKGDALLESQTVLSKNDFSSFEKQKVGRYDYTNICKGQPEVTLTESHTQLPVDLSLQSLTEPCTL